MSTSKELEAVARAIYEARTGKKWSILKSWADPSPENIADGCVGATSYRLRGDEDFSDARKEVESEIRSARAALLAIRTAMIDHILGDAATSPPKHEGKE